MVIQSRLSIHLNFSMKFTFSLELPHSPVIHRIHTAYAYMYLCICALQSWDKYIKPTAGGLVEISRITTTGVAQLLVHIVVPVDYKVCY